MVVETDGIIGLFGYATDLPRDIMCGTRRGLGTRIIANGIQVRLSCYARALPCPILTKREVLPICAYGAIVLCHAAY
eukprot:2463564-Rhodomonas_salina.3